MKEKKDEAITLEQLYIEQTKHESFYKRVHEYDDYNSMTVIWDKEIHLEEIYCRIHPFSKIVNVGLDKEVFNLSPVGRNSALESKKKAKENLHDKDEILELAKGKRKYE